MSYIQQKIKNNILKSYSNAEDILEKGGKRGIIGEIRNGYKKVKEGVWKKVSEHGMTKQEHYDKANKYYDKADDEKAYKEEDKAKHLDDKDYTDEDIMSESDNSIDLAKPIRENTRIKFKFSKEFPRDFKTNQESFEDFVLDYDDNNVFGKLKDKICKEEGLDEDDDDDEQEANEMVWQEIYEYFKVPFESHY